MDLNTVSDIVEVHSRDDLANWTPTAAWLAGGTWLFSEPQPQLDRLIDLAGLKWPAISHDEHGLHVAATCKIAQLHAWSGPPEWIAANLIDRCCRSLLGSFKVWNVATVGGNICLALPAAPMISLATALEGVCTIWTPDGVDRQVAITDFIVGAQKTVLRPGEILRSVDFPAEALRRRTAFRQISLTPLGRSGALLIGTLSRNGAFALSVTASTARPIRLTFAALPTRDDLKAAVEHQIPVDLYHDDVHGRPDWRRHVTFHFAEDIRAELAGERLP